MNRTLVIVALSCGTAGFWLGNATLSPPAEPIGAMLVVSHDVAAGEALAPADVAVAVRPTLQSSLPPEAQTLVLGRAPQEPLRKGQPLALEGLANGSPTVPNGTRVATFDLATRTSWIARGDRVDVLLSVRDPQTEELATVTLLQNVSVVGALRLDAPTLRVSVLVIPEEAEVLMEAQRLGTLDVTLRNRGDTDVMEERGRATVNSVLSGERTRLLRYRYLDLGCRHVPH